MTIEVKGVGPYVPRERQNSASGVIARLRRIWDERRKRMRQRRTEIELRHIDPRLLRDMGIEPQDVFDAMQARRSRGIFEFWSSWY